jgi:hypothetical protein
MPEIAAYRKIRDAAFLAITAKKKHNASELSEALCLQIYRCLL